MNPLEKSSRISWASGSNLCQVRLFSSEDCPSKIGVDAQNYPQVKAVQISWLNCIDSNHLPPGKLNPLKDIHVNSLKEIHSLTSRTKWRCPPQFVCDHNWFVASGEESKEREAQRHREMRVLEAIYPSVSAIPTSPSPPLDVEDFHRDDSYIPVIPIIPMEEEISGDLPSDATAPSITSVNSQTIDLALDSITQKFLKNPITNSCAPPKSSPASDSFAQGMLPALDSNVVVAAAATALAAAMKIKEEDSLIDTDLLIGLLSNPQMIEKLSNGNGLVANGRSEHVLPPKPASHLVSLPGRKPDLLTKKLANKRGAGGSFRIASISKSKTLIPLDPLPGLAPELASIKKSGNELGIPVASPIPVSKPIAQSIPFQSSTNTEMAMLKDLIIENGAPALLGISNTPGLRPPAHPSFSLPASTPDVKTIKRMINEYGTLDNNNGKEHFYGSKALNPSAPLLTPKHDMVALTRLDLQPTKLVPQPTFHMKSPNLSTSARRPSSATTAHIVDGIYYAKNLIRKHGDCQRTKCPKFGNTCNNIGGPPRPKHPKPCMYFNSTKGCRNGSDCPYQHEVSSLFKSRAVLDVSVSKRIKLGEISERI